MFTNPHKATASINNINCDALELNLDAGHIKIDNATLSSNILLQIDYAKIKLGPNVKNITGGFPLLAGTNIYDSKTIDIDPKNPELKKILSSFDVASDADDVTFNNLMDAWSDSGATADIPNLEDGFNYFQRLYLDQNKGEQ